MSVKRATRVASLLREVLSEILATQLKDPSVGRVTISRVTVSDDIRHAKVFFSLLGNEGDREKALAGLRRAAGFIRAEMGKRVELRFAPSLEFVYDDTVDYADRINRLLKQVLPPEARENSPFEGGQGGVSDGEEKSNC
ncbi:30S ribosome-binding factor RbfA [candidate division KSB1 bacterium]|nr:30S ribosome-binding factor RbfA [candidate division KSB1 bacterium]